MTAGHKRAPLRIDEKLIFPATCLMYAGCFSGWAAWVPVMLVGRALAGDAW